MFASHLISVLPLPSAEIMPDNKPPSAKRPSSYRERASAMQEKAGQARFSETRDNLWDVARWYEALADHVERRRTRDGGGGERS